MMRWAWVHCSHRCHDAFYMQIDDILIFLATSFSLLTTDINTYLKSSVNFLSDSVVVDLRAKESKFQNFHYGVSSD